MLFDNNNIETLLSESKSFSLEGFNIFAIGKDDLSHIVCTAHNKSTARALHGLLEIAKKAQSLQGINGYLSGDCFLVPQVLANGQVVLAATTITWDDTIFKDSVEVNFSEEIFQIEAGTPAYDEFIEKLRKA